MRPEIQNAIRLLRCSHPQSLDAALAVLQNTIFSFSMKICGHREDSEDTMQDTLLRAARQLPNFESPEALAVWLYQVASSRCLMSRRLSKFAPQQHLSLEEVMPDRAELEALTSKHRDGSPEHQLLRAESREELQQAVLRIPPLYRLVLVLHDMEELSPVGIARVTGLRPGTVRVRLHRARAFLRNELARRPAGRRPIRGSRLLHAAADGCLPCFPAHGLFQAGEITDTGLQPSKWASSLAHKAGSSSGSRYSQPAAPRPPDQPEDRGPNQEETAAGV